MFLDINQTSDIFTTNEGSDDDINELVLFTNESIGSTTPIVEYTRILSKFRTFTALLRYSYVIYADFECFPVEIPEKDQHLEKAMRSYQKHVPHSAAYRLVCTYNDLPSQLKSYRAHKSA